jgi:tRNA(fMet)-specific endonuclease VapC
MTYLLDTNICIPLINQADVPLKERLLAESPSDVVLCSVVEAELYFGANNSARLAENLDRVERFCRAFTSLPVNSGAARHYGAVRARLRREGRVIGANDMLIASVCLAAGVTLVTRNVGEFRRVPGLAVEAW